MRPYRCTSPPAVGSAGAPLTCCIRWRPRPAAIRKSTSPTTRCVAPAPSSSSNSPRRSRSCPACQRACSTTVSAKPLPAGLRTQQRLSRQTLYQAGDYSLDLRLENERGTSRVALVGQIQNRKQPGKRLGSVPVLLVSGKKILAHAVSNSLGEFQMEYAPQKHQRLYVPVHRSGKRVRVFLNKLRTEKTAVGKATEEISSSKKGPKLC